MKQRGLFDEIERLEELTKLGDPLLVLNEKIKWESFRPILKEIRMENPDNIRNAGRKPFDEVMMFRVIILQRLYGLSDDQMEFQLKDRRSFERFVSGGEAMYQMPDAKTIWLYKERFGEHGISRKAFRKFNHQLEKANLMAKSGKIVDASFVEVPRQRNTREENRYIKEEGTYPDTWGESKKRQKDIEARWTEKNKRRYYGYKNHVAVDRKRKFILDYTVTTAEVHDSRPLFEIIGTPRDKKEPVWGDSAYRSEYIEKRLARRGFISNIHEKGYRHKPLTAKQRENNTKKSRTRARIEHIFGMIHWMKGNYLRCIGLKRISESIGMINLAYNMRRYCLYA